MRSCGKSVKKIYNNLIDFLFPAKCIFCGRKIAADSEIFCCIPCMLYFSKPTKDCCYETFGKSNDFVISPLEYKGCVRKAIYNFKFRSRPYYAKTFSHFLDYALSDIYKSEDFDIVTCVPSGKKKLKKRGYNPAWLIAKNLCVENAEFADDILIRTNEKQAQSLKNFAGRIKNVENSFSYQKPVDKKKILLVDDVCTTGATLNECAKNLYLAGASKVVCASAAKTVFNSELSRRASSGLRIKSKTT